MQTTSCVAPAKLILTGEHAVLNQTPALSIAIDLKTTCQIIRSAKQNIFCDIELVNFQQKTSLSFKHWETLAIDIEKRFSLYQNKKLPIQMVLIKPVDLIITCLYHFQQQFSLKNFYWDIKISGHSLLSRGLGSSAAVIISLLYSLYKQNNIKINNEAILALAIIIENRQHGESSGLDLATILFGGLIKYQRNQPIQTIACKNINAWLVDTGKPESSTGEAVSFVQNNFKPANPIWKNFAAIAENLEQSWLKQDYTQIKKIIKENQLLLETLGIVPNKVKQFLKSLTDCVGKVCGSGTVKGNSAGIILCIGKPPTELCEEYGYPIFPISINTQGVLCEMDN